MGNTSFEHFSSHWYLCLKSSILLRSLIGFIYDLLGKGFDIEIWLHILWYEFWEMTKYGFDIYVFFGIFDINMRSIWIWILPGIYKVEKLKRGISLYVFSRLFWCVVKYGFEICDLKVLILICTQFGFWFGFTYDYK